jgi:esterase/lipase
MLASRNSRSRWGALALFSLAIVACGSEALDGDTPPFQIPGLGDASSPATARDAAAGDTGATSSLDSGAASSLDSGTAAETAVAVADTGAADTGADAGTMDGSASGDASVADAAADGATGDGASASDSATTSDATTADAGGDSGTQGAFPRASEGVNVARKGPYTFKTYTEGLSDRVYGSAIMYYPVEATPPYAAIAFTPGFTATKEDYSILGEIFASHGFAMLMTTPTSTLDYPPARGDDLAAAHAKIIAENTRAGGVLNGKIATDRICITGHSMGGGGTLWGATNLAGKIRCAMPLQPWEPGTRFASITAPILFIASEADDIAGVAQNATVHYGSIPNTVEKVYAEFKGADHYLTTNRGVMWEEQSTLMVAFYKLHLEDDRRYLDFIYGAKAPKAALSKLEFGKQP